MRVHRELSPLYSLVFHFKCLLDIPIHHSYLLTIAESTKSDT